MTDDIDIAQPYVGKWTCSECGDTSDNEHDPCSCDDTCTEHIETIDSLRRRLKQDEAERDALRQQLEAARTEADAWEKIARERHATLEAMTRERDEARAVLSHIHATTMRQIAYETAEAIAAWCESPCPCGEADCAAKYAAIADAIRAGAWRAKEGK